MEFYYSNVYPPIMQFLGLFGLDTRLYYRLPVAAIIFLALYCILDRARVRKWLGERAEGFVRGILLFALLLSALLAAGNYTNFAQWRYNSFFNAYEFYHYYLGTKYAPEIGYSHLYNASLIADEESGLKYSNPRKTIRDLETGRHVPIEGVLAQRDRFRGLFSQPRWEEWKKDIEFFKRELTTGRWNGVLSDKGYNGTPVWGMLVGGLLSNPISTDNKAGMNFLASLDLILIGLATLCVAYAFGPRAALLMLIFLGTSYMSRFSHMKGSFLRTDFAMSLVMAVCMVKKNHYRTAGVLVAYSALARVFPAVYLFGLGGKFFWEFLPAAWKAVAAFRAKRYWTTARIPFLLGAALVIATHVPWVILSLQYAASPYQDGVLQYRALWPILLPGIDITLLASLVLWWGLRNGVIDMRYWRFFSACGLTILVLCAASIGYAGGTHQWKEYAEKIGRHNQDISPWRVGLKYVFITKLPEDLNYKETAGELARHAVRKVLNRPPETPESTPGVPASRLQRPVTSKTYLEKWAPFTRSTLYIQNMKTWYMLQAAMLIFCLFAVRGMKDHQALAFSFVPCFFLASPTYYYYIMLLVPFLFFASELDRPTRAIGLVWMYVIAMAGYYFYDMWQQKFSTYSWLSFMLLGMVLYMMLLAAFIRRSKFHGALVALASTMLVIHCAKLFPQFKPDEALLAWTPLILLVYALFLAVLEWLWRHWTPPPPLLVPAYAGPPVEAPEPPLEAPPPSPEYLAPLEEAPIEREEFPILEEMTNANDSVFVDIEPIAPTDSHHTEVSNDDEKID